MTSEIKKKDQAVKILGALWMDAEQSCDLLNHELSHSDDGRHRKTSKKRDRSQDLETIEGTRITKLLLSSPSFYARRISGQSTLESAYNYPGWLIDEASD